MSLFQKPSQTTGSSNFVFLFILIIFVVMNENNSYSVETIRIETRKIPTSMPLSKQEEILMDQYKELYRIHLIRSAMGGAKKIHSDNGS